MIVTCEHCGARYKLDDSKITGRGAKITCPRCRHLFVVYRNAGDANGDGQVATDDAAAPVRPSPESPSPADSSSGSNGHLNANGSPPAARAESTQSSLAPAPSGPIDVHTLDFRRVGIPSWKVKVKIGLVYDFSDYRTLRKYIQDGRVTPSDHLSYDAETWVPIASIPDLEQYFIDIYMKRASDVKPSNGRDPAADDDGPTVIVGAVNLASSISAHLGQSNTPSPSASSGMGSGSVAAAFAASVAASANEGGGSGVAAMQSSGGRGSSVAIPGLSSASASSLATDMDADPSGAFADPFEALKSKQRNRIKKNRTQSRVKTKQKGGGNRIPIDMKAAVAGTVLIVATGVVCWEIWTFWLKPPVPLQNIDWGTMQDPRFGDPFAMEGAEGLPIVEQDDPWQKKMDAMVEEAGQNRTVITASEDAEQEFVRPVAQAPIPTDDGAQPNTIEKEEPRSAAEYQAAGQAAMLSQDWTTAAQYFAQAIKLDPNNQGHYTQRGISQARAGDQAGAYKTLSIAAKLGSTVAHKEMGHIDRDRGDVAAALTHYQTYLRTNPPDKTEIEAEIAKLQGN